jgi:hypothetical protein
MGHFVVSDGKGGTVEAMSRAYDVPRGKVSGRVWNTGVFLPDFSYGNSDGIVTVDEPAAIYAVGRPGMRPAVVKAIKRVLKEFGIDPGPINGEYDALTATAVAPSRRQRASSSTANRPPSGSKSISARADRRALICAGVGPRALCAFLRPCARTPGGRPRCGRYSDGGQVPSSSIPSCRRRNASPPS